MTGKYSGNIGYIEEIESKPGVWTKVVTERKAYGDVKRNSRGIDEDGAKVNSDRTVGNSISIVADEYANGHIFAMEYLWWRGARWIITNVNVEPPRLILRLGGLYTNGSSSPAP